MKYVTNIKSRGYRNVIHKTGQPTLQLE